MTFDILLVMITNHADGIKAICAICRVNVIGEADNGAKRSRLSEVKPHMVLMDISLPVSRH